MLDLLRLLTQVLILLAFTRIAVELLPRWLLISLLLLMLLFFGVIDPRVIQTMKDAASEPLKLLIPFLLILVAFRIVASGAFGKKR